jgi:hypothetical protein
MVVPERIISQEELKDKWEHNLTVGDLLDYIEKNNLPRDAKVLSQRIEDRYFETGGWGVVVKEGHWFDSMVERNKDIDAGEYDDPEEYPLLESKRPAKFPEDDLDQLMEQYHPVWCGVKYKDDDNLYLDLHY